MEAATKTTRKKGAKTIVREYFDALSEQDLDRAVSYWKPGAIDRIHGVIEMVAPDGVRDYFAEIFGAFPDWSFEVIEIAGGGDLAAARWRVNATFSGPGRYQGIAPTGKRVTLEGCDMFRVADGKLVENNAYANGLEIAQQLGLLPPQGSAAERAMFGAFNAKTAAAGAIKRFRER